MAGQYLESRRNTIYFHVSGQHVKLARQINLENDRFWIAFVAECETKRGVSD